MTQREQYDGIYNSMINGQRKQAIAQINELGLHEVPDMLDYFYHDLNRPELVLDVCKSYFRITTR